MDVEIFHVYNVTVI